MPLLHCIVALIVCVCFSHHHFSASYPSVLIQRIPIYSSQWTCQSFCLQCLIHFLGEMLFAKQRRGGEELQIEHHTSSTMWLWEPMRKCCCWFHSVMARTLIHPLCCSKAEMLPQLCPSPIQLCSTRHRWMCTHSHTLMHMPILNCNHTPSWQETVTQTVRMWLCVFGLFWTEFNDRFLI